MKIDLQSIRDFRKDFEEAVKDLEQKYGVVVTLGQITYGYDEFYCRMAVKNGQSKEELFKKEFEADCAKVGLYPEDYGQTFMRHGHTFKIVGLDLKKRKYPVIIEDTATGKTMRCSVGYLSNDDPLPPSSED